MTEEKRRLPETFPLFGLFDQDSFLLPQVDQKIIEFLCNVMETPALHRSSAMCLVSFYRHPSFFYQAKNQTTIFYRWAAWADDLGMNSEAKEKFKTTGKYEERWEFAIGSDDVGYTESMSTTLAAEFLFKFGRAVQSTPYDEVNELELMSENGPISIRMGTNALWVLEEPTKYKNFAEVFANSKTQWCLYRPIRVAGRIAGLVSIDGIRRCPDQDSRRSIAVYLNLLELIFESLYKTYYRQMDYDFGELSQRTIKDVSEYWSQWDSSGLVYSSEFEKDLISLLGNPDRSIFLGDKDIAEPFRRFKGFLIAYIDGNGIKSINDKSSHLVGNEVIRAMGRWLHDLFWLCSRGGITAPALLPPGERKETTWVIRIGGDEFRIILACCNKINANGFSRAINKNLKNYLYHRNKAINNLTSGLNCIREQLHVELDPNDNSWLERVGMVGFAGAYLYTNSIDAFSFGNHCFELEDSMYTVKNFIKGRRPRDWKESWPLSSLCASHKEARSCANYKVFKRILGHS